MTENDRYVMTINIKSLILLVAESIIIFLLFRSDFKSLFFGLWFGGIFSIIFFNILYRNILFAIEKTKSQAKRIVTINYIIRYLISGLILYVAAKSNYLNLFTCLIGLLTIKLVFYLNNMVIFFKDSKVFKKGRKK